MCALARLRVCLQIERSGSDQRGYPASRFALPQALFCTHALSAGSFALRLAGKEEGGRWVAVARGGRRCAVDAREQIS